MILHFIIQTFIFMNIGNIAAENGENHGPWPAGCARCKTPPEAENHVFCLQKKETQTHDLKHVFKNNVLKPCHSCQRLETFWIHNCNVMPNFFLSFCAFSRLWLWLIAFNDYFTFPSMFFVGPFAIFSIRKQLLPDGRCILPKEPGWAINSCLSPPPGISPLKLMISHPNPPPPKPELPDHKTPENCEPFWSISEHLRCLETDQDTLEVPPGLDGKAPRSQNICRGWANGNGHTKKGNCQNTMVSPPPLFFNSHPPPPPGQIAAGWSGRGPQPCLRSSCALGRGLRYRCGGQGGKAMGGVGYKGGLGGGVMGGKPMQGLFYTASVPFGRFSL